MIRRKIFYWLVDKVFKVPECAILPKGLRILRMIFFPIEHCYYTTGHFRYDSFRDIFIIYGRKYSGTLFKQWSADGLPVGRIIEIIENDEETIMLREIYGCEGCRYAKEEK